MPFRRFLATPFVLGISLTLTTLASYFAFQNDAMERQTEFHPSAYRQLFCDSRGAHARAFCGLYRTFRIDSTVSRSAGSRRLTRQYPDDISPPSAQTGL